MTALAVLEGDLFAAVGGTVFKSSDDGASWEVAAEGLVDSGRIDDLLAAGASLYAATNRGIYRSRDRGLSWAGPGEVLTHRITTTAFSLAAIGSELYATISLEGVFRSRDGGRTWREASHGLGERASLLAGPLHAVGPDVYLGTFFSGPNDEAQIFKSSDGGASWQEVFTGFPGRNVNVLASNGESVFAAIRQSGLLRSNDGGATWEPINDGFRSDAETMYSLLAHGGAVYAGTSSNQIYKSTDNGDSWEKLPMSGGNGQVEALAASGSHLVAGLLSGISRSGDGGATWENANRGLNATEVLSIHISPEGLFAGTRRNGAFRSRDRGASWTSLDLGGQIVDFTESNGAIYAGVWTGGVFNSDDGGDAWMRINDGLSETAVQSLAALASQVFVAAGGSVFRSDDGASWVRLEGGLPEGVGVAALAVLGGEVFAGSQQGIFKSPDGGETWTQASEERSQSLVAVGGDLFSSANDGLRRSSDGGATWSRLSTRGPRALGSDGTHLFLSRDDLFFSDGRFESGGVFRSSDRGESEQEIDLGLPLPPFYRAVAADGQRVYVGTGDRGVVVAANETSSCVDEWTAACLTDERFDVRVSWRDFKDNRGQARVVPFGSDDSGLLYFFDGENWEMLVKVLDACGLNDHFWVFAAATTNVEYQLDVIDTLSGESKSYFNQLGTSAPAITDTEAFATCSSSGSSRALAPAAIGRPEPRRRRSSAALGGTASQILGGAGCSPSADALCLGDGGGRFLVEVSWRDFSDASGQGKVVPFGSADSGLFYFFDPDNWEMLVKILDGCGLNDHYWVFSAATTTVEYTLKVTDTETGAFVEYTNPLGQAADAITDVGALAVCPE